MLVLWIACAVMLCAHSADALEGRALYDYMIQFMEVNWNTERYQRAIDSILGSPQWKALDAQYGPWAVPPPPTRLRRVGGGENHKEGKK
jgi:hypothetical protein